MKTILIAFAIALCGIGTLAQEPIKPNPNASAQSTDLAEADRLESLASTSFSKRDYKAAAELLKKSLALKEKALGVDHSDVATTLHSLANVYQSLGKYDDAEPFYLRSISIRETKLGASHPDTIQVVKDYACSYHKRRSGPDKKPDQNTVRLLKRASCLFAGLADDCESDGILNGKAVLLVTPPYPRGAQVTQRIYVYVHISEEGRMTSATAPCGDPLLAKAAVEAARQAKFKPKLVNGNPVQVDGILIYDFVHQ